MRLAVVEELAVVAQQDELAGKDLSIFLSTGIHHLEIVVVVHEEMNNDQFQT